MSKNVVNTGWWAGTDKFASRPQSVVLPQTDGRTLLLIPEYNAANAYALHSSWGDGSGTHRLKIYQSDLAGSNFTKVFDANICTWTTPCENLSGDLFSDGDVAVVYQRDDSKNLCFRRIDSSGWAAGTQEIVYSPASGESIHTVDVTVSDGDAVAVAFALKRNNGPKMALRVFIRGTGGAWVDAMTHALVGQQNPAVSMTHVTCQFVKGGAASSRPLIVAASSAQDGGADSGCRIFSCVVNESNGALVNWTLRRTYLAGNMSPDSGYFSRRTYLFRSSTNELVVAHIEGRDKKTMLVSRITFDGNTFAEPMPPQTSVLSAASQPQMRFAASYAKDVVNFYHVVEYSSRMNIVNTVAVIDRTTGTVRFSGHFRWDNMTALPDHMYPMSGAGRNSDLATMHRMLIVNLGVGFTVLFHQNEVAPKPTSVTPSGGTNISGTPEVGLRIRLGKDWPQSRHKARWQFASDSGFSVGVRTFDQAVDKFKKVENTSPLSSFVFFGDVLPEAMSLSSGTWYVRAAMVDEFGNVGLWSNASVSTYEHPASAINLSPSSGNALPSLAVTFSWDFSDPLVTDTQSAFQIVVERIDDGAVVYDSGKINSAAESHLTSLDPALAGIMLRWKIQVWDSDDRTAGYGEYATFAIAGPPSVVIDAPVVGGIVTSGLPAILFTPTVDGGRTIKAYHVTIANGDLPVKDSGLVVTEIASGTQVTWRPTMPILEDGAYDVAVTVIDSIGLSATVTREFSLVIAEAPDPLGLAASSASYNLEGAGYNLIQWADIPAPDFYSWQIWRKDDMLSYGTTIAEEGDWKLIDEVTGGSSYHDYYAPSGYQVNYRVRQVVRTPAGDVSISKNEPFVQIYPRSDGYWLIDASTLDPLAFRLDNVTADDFTEEWDENTYVIIGKGRHTDQGDYLGPTGTMTAQLRNGGNLTARQKRMQVLEAKKRETEIYIRNPFGDVIVSHIGNIGVSRIAGVGVDEFVDLTIPYSQVGL